MRSRLEAEYAAHFDRTYRDWSYEPQCFANEEGQYLPDFRVVTARCVAYVEVRGYPCDHDEAMRRMEIIWSSEPDAWLIYCHAEFEGPIYVARGKGSPWEWSE